MTESVQREIVVPQAPEEVWRALTDSARLSDWLMPNDFEPSVGHRFTFRSEPNPQAGWDGLVHCEVLECAAPSQLAYTWAGGGIDTRVSYRLEREGAGTRVFLEQSGFDVTDPGQSYAYQATGPGWDRLFRELQRVLAAAAAPR